MGILCLIFLVILSIILFRRLTCFYCRSKICMVGKTAVITGGANGIGFQAALTLASKGCRVIIGDVINYAEAAEEIIAQSHNPHVVGRKLDLGSFRSVREFAKFVNESEPRLDILVNNAGIGSMAVVKSDDGLNRTMQVNYYGHFLLTHLLLSLLKKSAPSRIVFTSSIVVFFSNFSIEHMNPTKPETGLNIIRGFSYGYSKVCQAIAAKTFADKLKGTGVSANTFHPGGVRSQIFFRNLKDDQSFWVVLLGLYTWIYGKNTEAGAQTLLHLAHSDEVKNVSGKFFLEGRQFLQPYQMKNKKLCDDVWKKSLELTRLLPHEISC